MQKLTANPAQVKCDLCPYEIAVALGHRLEVDGIVLLNFHKECIDLLCTMTDNVTDLVQGADGVWSTPEQRRSAAADSAGTPLRYAPKLPPRPR